jgi:hypothetical protein
VVDAGGVDYQREMGEGGKDIIAWEEGDRWGHP